MKFFMKILGIRLRFILILRDIISSTDTNEYINQSDSAIEREKLTYTFSQVHMILHILHLSIFD
jgi:hypothetical protein